MMARFLSPEWVSAFNDAVGDVAVAPPGDDAGLAARDGAYAWCQVVTGGPDGATPVTFRVAGGHLSVQTGEADDVDVTIRIDWVTAAALARGELSPAEAIATGRVQVRGDLAVLGTGQALLAALAPRLAAVHAATTY
jgi:hypothetical protein